MAEANKAFGALPLRLQSAKDLKNLERKKIMAEQVIPLERYRNFGIMAHIDAGKTTTTERILYYTGKSHKIGEVHDGGHYGLDGARARARDYTIRGDNNIQSSCDDEQLRYNIIDTPGHVDFTIELSVHCVCLMVQLLFWMRMRVLSHKLKQYGVKVTSTKFRMVFVNKMDKIGADFYNCEQMMIDRLGATPLVIQLPIGAEDQFALLTFENEGDHLGC